MSIIKKATILIVTAAAGLFSAFPVSAEDDETSAASEDIEYIVSGDYQYSVMQADDGSEAAFLEIYTGNDTDIVIPETIDGYNVAGLGDQTFSENQTIKTITISANLEEIGAYSFYGCTALTEFKVNEKNELFTLDSDGALVGNQGLLYIAYPIGKNPESITIPDGFVVINESAFALCKSLKEVKFPDTLEAINAFSFFECTSLKSLELPDSITEINNFSFSGCSSLESVKFSSNLRTIGDAAFARCKRLKTIDIPESLTTIGQAAFCATGLTSVTIPRTVTSIDYSAFGFDTDASNNIIANEDFVIMGYLYSAAASYCVENEVTFVSIDEEEEPTAAAATEPEKEKSGMKPGVIVGICIAGAAVIILIVVFIVIKKSKNGNSDDSETDDNDNDNDDDDAAEDE